MEKNMEMEIFDKIIRKSEIFTKFKVFQKIKILNYFFENL
jgi:hypothetical protein